MLELAGEMVRCAHALRTVLVPLLGRMRARRRAGLARQLDHGPRERGVIVDPVVRVDVRGFPLDELASALVLRAIFDQHFVSVDIPRVELRRSPEGSVPAHERRDAERVRQRPRVRQHEVYAEIEGRGRARERCRVSGARRVRHERRAGDDAVAVSAHDAVVDARGTTEVVRIDDEPLHRRSRDSSAARTSQPDASRRRRASASSRPVSSRTIRIARSRSFALTGRMSIMRSPFVRPSFTIVAVEIMLRTSFVAVPALSRLDPARISGPTRTTTATSASLTRGDPPSHVIATVRAPISLALARAAMTERARPLAEMPTSA